MENMRNRDVLGSPFGSVLTQPEFDQVMNCALGLRHPIDVVALKAELSASLISHHPRFTSLIVHKRTLVRPFKRQYWRKTKVNIDDHVMVVDPHRNADADNEISVNGYLADLAVSPPMRTDKPLWEVHVLEGLNCVVLRVHHAICDGVSLISLLTTCFGGDKAVPPVTRGEEARSSWRNVGPWDVVKSLCYTTVYEVGFVSRILGVVRDQKTVVSGGAGMELWPRKVVTSKFMVDDMKGVKEAIPHSTMNDVLLGVIARGLAKYFDLHIEPGSISTLQKIQKYTLIRKIDIKTAEMKIEQDMKKLKSGSSLGNKIGMFLVPMKCDNEVVPPLQHVTRMKSIMDCKKKSFEDSISYSLLDFAFPFLGSKITSWFYKRILATTTLLISNIVGPRQEIVIAGNPVTFIKLSISSLCQAITIHLVSYNGRAEMQISIAKYIISDADLLANCFEDALMEMKNDGQSSQNVTQ